MRSLNCKSLLGAGSNDFQSCQRALAGRMTQPCAWPRALANCFRRKFNSPLAALKELHPIYLQMANSSVWWEENTIPSWSPSVRIDTIQPIRKLLVPILSAEQACMQLTVPPRVLNRPVLGPAISSTTSATSYVAFIGPLDIQSTTFRFLFLPSAGT
jgi:hypothetical protein